VIQSLLLGGGDTEPGHAPAVRLRGARVVGRLDLMGAFAALLPVHERVHGPEHPHTLATRYSLARWTGEAGDTAGARDQLAILLPVDERVHGTSHPRTLRARRDLTHWIAKSR
jgi:hypothetical protein